MMSLNERQPNPEKPLELDEENKHLLSQFLYFLYPGEDLDYELLREFTEGKTATRVFLVRLIHSVDDRSNKRIIIKTGPAHALREEVERYLNIIKSIVGRFWKGGDEHTARPNSTKGVQYGSGPFPKNSRTLWR